MPWAHAFHKEDKIKVTIMEGNQEEENFISNAYAAHFKKKGESKKFDFKTKAQVKILLNKGRKTCQKFNVSIVANLVIIETNVLRN